MVTKVLFSMQRLKIWRRLKIGYWMLARLVLLISRNPATAHNKSLVLSMASRARSLELELRVKWTVVTVYFMYWKYCIFMIVWEIEGAVETKLGRGEREGFHGRSGIFNHDSCHCDSHCDSSLLCSMVQLISAREQLAAVMQWQWYITWWCFVSMLRIN